MCTTCGCDGKQHAHEPTHDHDHEHAHAHDERLRVPGRKVRLEEALLAKNDRAAARNRAWLAERRVCALNLMSSPGAGKTTLLEATLRRLRPSLALSVLEGDQATDRDAARIRATGCAVHQINTGTGCHLDGEMMAEGLRALDPPWGSMVLVENVGNLVCPALFDLGERKKVVVLSVTEGEDKPLKYPHMFAAAQVLVLNKIDLLPHLAVDVDACVANARAVNPSLRVFSLSATRGDGLDAWCDWLRQEHAASAAIAIAGGRQP